MSPALTSASTDQHVLVDLGSTGVNEAVRCRVCGRRLLMGERSSGFFTQDGAGPYDVCSLCIPRARHYGLRPTPLTPDELAVEKPRFRPLAALRAVLPRRRPRISGLHPVGSAAIPSALARFNQSGHAKMLAGLFKTLGAPRASVIPRAAADREVMLTVAWDIVWYQFRISPDGIESQRGTYLADLPRRWQHWNCRVERDGKVQLPEPLTAPNSAHPPRRDTP